MSHTALGCFWQVIAVPTSGILPDMDTFSQRIHRTLPHAMYFFQIISWDVPELYPLEVALAILCFLKNDEQELRWREEIIELDSSHVSFIIAQKFITGKDILSFIVPFGL